MNEKDKAISKEQTTVDHTAWLIAILSWLVPGAGHIVQKKYIRGTILGVVVIAMFVVGLAMGGKLTTLWDEDPTGSFFLQLLKSFANFGNGLVYFICLLTGIGTHDNPKAAELFTYEYGNTFTLVSGLLNYLIALDAFDIRVGRKE